MGWVRAVHAHVSMVQYKNELVQREPAVLVEAVREDFPTGPPPSSHGGPAIGRMQKARESAPQTRIFHHCLGQEMGQEPLIFTDQVQHRFIAFRWDF